MFILNQVSVASSFYNPVHTKAYIGSVSKEKKTVLHLGVEKHLTILKRELDCDEYEKYSRKVKLDPKNYLEAINYSAAFIHTPKDLSNNDAEFIRVTCDTYLCGEEEILEKLYVMTKKPKFLVCVDVIVEEMNYYCRITSSRGYGQLYLSNILISDGHKELESLNQL